MKPAEFAALLISRLESLKEQENGSSPKQRLQQIQEVGEAAFQKWIHQDRRLNVVLVCGRRRKEKRRRSMGVLHSYPRIL